MRSTEIFVLGDLHLPFHFAPVVSLIQKVIKARRPGAVVLIGDVFDNRALSRHLKDLSERNFRREFSDAQDAFQDLDDACSDVPSKVITMGNHDEYMSRYIAQNCPELEGYEGLKTPLEALGAINRGWEVLPYHEAKEFRGVKLGFIHDVNMSGDASVMTAAAKFGKSVVYGHTHNAAIRYSGNMEGEHFVAVNVGWLGDPQFAKYMPGFHKLNNWVHGLGHVRVWEDGLFSATFCPYVRGTLSVEGARYSL